MQKIKKINPLSLGYNLALIYLVFGILFSIFLLILRNSSNFINSINPAITNLPISYVFLLYPLGYAIGGFVTGYLIGFIYNNIVKITGGISIELSEKSYNSIKYSDLKPNPDEKKENN